MEKIKKIISILLVFLLTMGVWCNFKVFAQEIDISMPKEEYNKNIKEEFGLDENPTEKKAQELKTIIFTMSSINSQEKDWFSVNGKSDLMSLLIYTFETNETNPDKTYNVSYSEVDGYIRSFTINELGYTTYPGVMPTDEIFGMPFYSRDDWNNSVKKYIPQSPSEVSGKDLRVMINKLLSIVNYVLTENHPTWGLTINGKTKQEEIENIAWIKPDADYKVEYTMDNGYIRHFKIEEITASIPTPVPSETEQEETTSNPTESQKDTPNQESNKQHILDDEPKTGL